MITQPPKIALIDTFLRDHAWELVEEGGRFRRYRPAPALGLDTGYRLNIPSQEELPGAADLLTRAATAIAEFHDLSPEQLGIVLSVPDTVVSVQVQGETTSTGSMPLRSFEAMVEKIRKALVNTAAFVLTDAPLLDEAPEAAEKYLDRCRFLQTEVGSFVAKVQLPAATELAKPSLFRDTAVTSDEVNARFADVVDFAVNRVLTGNAEQLMSPAALNENASVVTVNVLADLMELFERTAAESVNIRFLSAREDRAFLSGSLDESRLRRLETFVDFARQTYAAETALVLEGKIVELRSRNPKGSKNHVVVQGVNDGRIVNVALSLGKSDYWHATQAHADGKKIRVAGLARQMKTQLRLSKVELFQVLD